MNQVGIQTPNASFSSMKIKTVASYADDEAKYPAFPITPHEWTVVLSMCHLTTQYRDRPSKFLAVNYTRCGSEENPNGTLDHNHKQLGCDDK